MSQKGNHILWLPRWYPSRAEPLSGDFIQRHARAASLFNHIIVLAVIRDKDMKGGKVDVVNSGEGNLKEIIVYYNVSHFPLKILERFFSFVKYCLISFSMLRKIAETEGRAKVIHLHVYGKNCLVGVVRSRFSRVPVLYSEHATAFLPESENGFHTASFFSKILVRKFLSCVDYSSFVSRTLASGVSAFRPSLRYQIIPNVVDEMIFRPSSTFVKNEKFRFIHISTLGFQKNFDAILDAFRMLNDKQKDFELMVFGPIVESLIKKTEEYGLKEKIKFMGERLQSEIAPCMQDTDALILYSRYETFGCVVIEALACGIPVIVSEIPVMHELLREGEDGLFVKGNDPGVLASKLEEFITNPLRPDRKKQHERTIGRYGMKAVGKLFEEFYQFPQI